MKPLLLIICFQFIGGLIPLFAVDHDSIPVFDLDEVYENYGGNKFFRMLSREGFDETGNENFDGWRGCDSCLLHGRFIAGANRSELFISTDKVEYSAIFADGRQIFPSYIGRGRKGYRLEVSADTPTELSIQFTSLPKYPISFHLHASEWELEKWVRKGHVVELGFMFHSVFLGCLAMVVLFSFSTFFFHRRIDVLFYGIYAALLFVYFGTDYALRNGIFYGSVGHYLKRLVHPAMFIAYIYFLKTFINARDRFPKLYTLYDRSVWFLLVIFVITVFSAPPYNRTFFDTIILYYQLVAGVVAIYIIYLLYKLQPPFYTFLIGGHSFLTLGSVAAIILSIYQIQLGFLLPLHWMMIGIICELILFSAALGYRMHLVNQEKIDMQGALIGEMKKNELILEDRQKELTEIVQLTETKFIEEERDKIRAEMSLEEKKVELDLLRNQMNPHFIFNSLNSIKSFIIKNQPRIAGGYITKFASLMRLILSNSKEIEIPLSKELEAIKLYVELEQLRMDDMFDFDLLVSEEIDTSRVSVQPLILQPFIENAIWHGLRYLEEPGLLRLQITKEEEQLEIIIEDTGIGREASYAKAKTEFAKSKSLGIEITKERLSKKYKSDYSLSIEDVRANHPNPGTRIRLKLPILITVEYEYN